MKKSLLVILMAVFIAAPVFAKNTDVNLELTPKIGYLFSPETTMKIDGKNMSSSNESAISLGVDILFDMKHNFFLGAGIMWGNTVKVSKDSNNKIGFTNVYATAKYKLLVNAKQEDPLFLYPLVQLGIGSPSYEYSGPIKDFEINSGLYWGIGAGCEYKNIILEFIYGCNYAVVNGKFFGKDYEETLSYTAFRINAGYKFNL